MFITLVKQLGFVSYFKLFIITIAFTSIRNASNLIAMNSLIAINYFHVFTVTVIVIITTTAAPIVAEVDYVNLWSIKAVTSVVSGCSSAKFRSFTVETFAGYVSHFVRLVVSFSRMGQLPSHLGTIEWLRGGYFIAGELTSFHKTGFIIRY